MTSNVELLPLYAELQGHPKIEIIKHYARANVEANTEALRSLYLMAQNHGVYLTEKVVTAEASIEALRQQRDFLVEEYERAVGCGQQGYTHAAMHLFNAITNAQVDQNANAIMALRAEVARQEGLKEQRIFQCDGWEHRALAAEARAEQLEEALRGMVENACAACDVLPNGTHRIDATEQEWDAHVAATDKALAALHPAAALDELDELVREGQARGEYDPTAQETDHE